LTAAFAIDPSRIRVIPNPVDLDRVRAAAEEPIDPSVLPKGDGPLIVAAGRLAEAKNYPLMIDAIAEVRKHLPVRLCILGQGELETSLKQLVAARGLADAIAFAGFQANPWKYIARADVFLLTSKYEGFGNVLIEAMACGVPVVATASAGTGDIINHDVDGLLVESHTAPHVAAALKSMLESRDRRQSMSAAARAAANRFAVEQVVSQYHSVMEQLAS
jgi:glycosyltransferase involved in cell wall biosynthesis